MQLHRKERARGARVGQKLVGREETGAGQLMGDSSQERGKSGEGTKGAEGNKKRSDKAPEGTGSRPEKTAKMQSEGRKGWERQRGAEETKVSSREVELMGGETWGYQSKEQWMKRRGMVGGRMGRQGKGTRSESTINKRG